jgi:hypothetical protein
MRKMNFIGLALAIFGSTIATQAQTDLSMREALYFTGAKTNAIDLKNDKYAAKGSTLNLSAELAKNCDKNICEFNVGFIGFRSGNTASELSSYGLISVDGGGAAGDTVLFAAAETTKHVIVPLKLKLGQNKLTFTIDPYKKIGETNEGNNTFTVNVLVNWRRGDAGPEK